MQEFRLRGVDFVKIGCADDQIFDIKLAKGIDQVRDQRHGPARQYGAPSLIALITASSPLTMDPEVQL